MTARIFDLTYLIEPGMLTFPGTPEIRLQKINTIEKSGFRETRFQFTSHVGTHIDAPAHLRKDGNYLDRFPADYFWGQAFFLDCRQTNTTIPLSHLKMFATQIESADFIILATGYTAKWPTPAYFEAFPVLSETAAQWLVEQNIKVIGADTISVDPMDSTALPIHQILLAANRLILENVKIPDTLINQTVEMVISPIKFPEADGSPVRIWAKCE